MAAEALELNLSLEGMLHLAAWAEKVGVLDPTGMAGLCNGLNRIFDERRIPLQVCLRDNQSSPLAVIRQFVRQRELLILFLRRKGQNYPIIVGGVDEGLIILSDPTRQNPLLIDLRDFRKLAQDLAISSGEYLGQLYYDPQRLLTIAYYPVD